MTKRAAISALGTRISFLVIAWLMLSRAAKLVDVAIVAGAQLLAYIVFRQVAQRLRPVPAAADVLSIAVLGAIAYALSAVTLWGLSNLVVLASLAALLAALRAFGDRSPDPIISAQEEKPGRDGLSRVLLFLAGAIVGAAALWFGPLGALWANAMVFAAAAVLGALSKATPTASDMDSRAIVDLHTDPLVRRLALTLFATNLFAQAGAVLVVVIWSREVTQTPELLGLVATAFMLGLIGGGLAFAGVTRNGNGSLALSLGALAGGAAAYLILLDRPPALLLVVAASLVSGVAMASVIPLTGTLLSEHVPAALRSKVDGWLSSVAFLGIPLGTCAAAWYVGRATEMTGLAAAAGAFLVAMLIPVFVFRSWRQLLPDAPSTLGGQARLPARLTVTLAYANGQWIVEVRRGRALLGSRHLVKSGEAMNMLAVLDVPGVQDSVEKALSVDQVEAARQAERMRSELSELEARLAGLTEMVEITESHRPAPKQRDGEEASTVQP